MTKKSDWKLHERYDRSKPLLRELVTISAFTDDGDAFDIILTRVPCIGEEISRGSKTYTITSVQHAPVDDDGRSPYGSHGYVEAMFKPDDNSAVMKAYKVNRKKAPRRKARRSRSR